jgi:type I restriction enzyme R subunit
LLNAHDPDVKESLKFNVQSSMLGQAPDAIDSAFNTQHSKLVSDAVAAFHNPDFREFLVDVRKKYDQIIDTVNIDEITNIGWVKDNKEKAEQVVHDFKAWIEKHKTEITALQIFYAQAYRRRELTFKMIKDLYELLKSEKPTLAPMQVWRAYEQIEQVNESPKNELVALVALIRRVSGVDSALMPYDKTVDKNFQEWVFKKQAGNLKFTEEQMQWLRMMKDYVATSFHIDKDDFDLSPFNAQGGLGKMWALFGEKYEEIIEELNEILAA